MKFQLYSKNISITDSLRVYLDDKLTHLDKLGEPITACRVDVSRDEHHNKGDVFRFEVNINIPNKLLRIVEKQADIRAAIDIGTDKLMRQLSKQKGKQLDKRRRLSNFWRRYKNR